MAFLRRLLTVALVVTGFACLGSGRVVLWAWQEAQSAAVSAPVSLTPEAMEVFLKTAKIVDMRDAGDGVTRSRRVKLTDGTITHDAHVQVIDDARPVFQAKGVTELNFKDSYRFNIAAFRLARLLGLDNVPMSVERRIEAKTAAVTWWVDDVQFDEEGRLKQKAGAMGPNPSRTSNQIAIMKVFDELIQNKDRNQGNILWTTDWTLWMIDHTRAFRLDRKLQKPDQLNRIDRGLLERLRNLDANAVREALNGLITQGEINAVMQRRDAIVKHFDERIKKIGEAAVLFSLRPET